MSTLREEPTFTLRASDPLAPDLLRQWVSRQTISAGPEEQKKLDQALVVAGRMELWRKENGPRRRPTAPKIVIEHLGGICPVQAEGTINGKPFYFRARGSSWTLNIGGDDVVMEPEWQYREDYGDWPAAGWMEPKEAEAFLRKAAQMYVDALDGAA